MNNRFAAKFVVAGCVAILSATSIGCALGESSSDEDVTSDQSELRRSRRQPTSDAGTTAPAPTAPAPTPTTSPAPAPAPTTAPAPAPAPSEPPSNAVASACATVQSGGTGNEPGGTIAVCCAPAAADKVKIDEVFRLLNQYRSQNQLTELVYDPKLELAIQGHAIHMGTHGFFSHISPEASVDSPWTRAALCGTSANGENLAAGYATAQDVMTGWKNSSGHNANMLNAGWRRVGIAYYNGQWGQIFGM